MGTRDETQVLLNGALHLRSDQTRLSAFERDFQCQVLTATSKVNE
jgi:hypothetical protein